MTSITALIAAIMSLNALAIDVMLPALPHMGEALGIPEENQRQFVISVYMIGFGLGQLAVGPLSDRFGRRAPLLLGIGIYVVAILAAAGPGPRRQRHPGHSHGRGARPL